MVCDIYGVLLSSYAEPYSTSAQPTYIIPVPCSFGNSWAISLSNDSNNLNVELSLVLAKAIIHEIS